MEALHWRWDPEPKCTGPRDGCHCSQGCYAAAWPRHKAWVQEREETTRAHVTTVHKVHTVETQYKPSTTQYKPGMAHKLTAL